MKQNNKKNLIFLFFMVFQTICIIFILNKFDNLINIFLVSLLFFIVTSTTMVYIFKITGIQQILAIFLYNILISIIHAMLIIVFFILVGIDLEIRFQNFQFILIVSTIMWYVLVCIFTFIFVTKQIIKKL